MVARAGGNADERKPVRECGRRDDGQRSVAAGDAERVGAARDGVGYQRPEVVVRAQDDHVDAALARALGEPGTRGFAAARLRIDEEHRAARWISGSAVWMQVGPGQEQSVSGRRPRARRPSPSRRGPSGRGRPSSRRRSSHRREGVATSRDALRHDTPAVEEGQRQERAEGEAADVCEEGHAAAVCRGRGETEVPLDKLVEEPAAQVDPGRDLDEEHEHQRSDPCRRVEDEEGAEDGCDRTARAEVRDACRRRRAEEQGHGRLRHRRDEAAGEVEGEVLHGGGKV